MRRRRWAALKGQLDPDSAVSEPARDGVVLLRSADLGLPVDLGGKSQPGQGHIGRQRTNGRRASASNVARLPHH